LTYPNYVDINVTSQTIPLNPASIPPKGDSPNVHRRGKFGWYELMTTDTAAAGPFYSSVVGWTTQDVGMPGMPYTTFNIGAAGMAGMMTLPPEAACAMGQPPSWIGYIHVPDTDAYVEKVVAAGGARSQAGCRHPRHVALRRQSPIRRARPSSFSQPTRPCPLPPKPAVGSPGTIGWHELMAADGAAAFEFYSTLFGWTKGPVHDMGPMGPLPDLQVDGDRAAAS
jgi:predicted enzyme related to lactoylglutathione lyase